MLTRLSGGSDAALRRAFDITIAFAVLVLGSPFLLLISLAVVVEDPGPVLFSQIRLGAGGRPFRIYKFRKFWHAQEHQTSHLTLSDDPRLTNVGRVLERAKLDELPQFLNVLQGTMSLVGPRPESLAFADCFVGEFRKVLDYKPGLFGPNQATFRNEKALLSADEDPHHFYRTVLFPLKARTDLEYFPRRNLAADAGWLVRGALAVCGLIAVADRDLVRIPSGLGRGMQLPSTTEARFPHV